MRFARSLRMPCRTYARNPVARRALPGWRARPSHGIVAGIMTPSYRSFRLPAEVIEHAAWLYHGVSLSLRFGRLFADTLKRRRPRPGDKWHFDEAFVGTGGELHHLWRVVDQDGNVLDILVRSRRNAKAAQRFSRKRHARPALRPTGGRDRQAQEQRRRDARDPVRSRTPAKPLPGQPGRGVASVDPAVRAADAAVQVRPPRATPPFCPQPHPQPRPSPPLPPDRRPTPRRTRRRLPHRARSRRRCVRSVRA